MLCKAMGFLQIFCIYYVNKLGLKELKEISISKMRDWQSTQAVFHIAGHMEHYYAGNMA